MPKVRSSARRRRGQPPNATASGQQNACGQPPNATASSQQNVCGQPPNATASSQQNAYLGIDIGSHRTRACLWVDGTDFVIYNKASHNLGGTSYAGDFSSTLYVFDDLSDVYYVDRQDKYRQSVSAKYAFYPLAGMRDTLLEQYPPVHYLMDRQDSPQFRKRLRQGLMALLSVLRDGALTVCRIKGLCIAKIGLTIPVQWTLEFEDVYSRLVSKVFGMDRANIYFYTETEALARYLYKYHADVLDPENQYNTIMFFDYGGHNMNGCMFVVARDSANPEANGFMRVGKTFGAGGGSEEWEHHIGEWLANIWALQNSTLLPPEYREELLSRFRTQKGMEAALREKVTVTFTRPEDDAPWRGTLTQDIIEDAWRKGLERPLETAKHEISRLAKMVRHERVSNPLVVVSGGTARNPAVKSRMKALCKDSGVEILFTDDFDIPIPNESAKVAMAAAYVVSETLTVDQFFRRGAAIGIQMRQAPKSGKPKWPREWDSSASLLLEKHRPHKAVKLGVQSPDEFRLICDPFSQPLLIERRKYITAKRSYNLVYLGKRKQGTWLFRLSLDGSGNTMSLLLEQHYKQRKELPWTAEKTLRLPLYYDGNSGCIHIGVGNKDIDELALGLPPQPDEFGQVNIDPTEELDDEPDSYSHQEQQSVPPVASSLVSSSYTNLRFNSKDLEGSDLDMFPPTTPSWALNGKDAQPLTGGGQGASQSISGTKPQHSLKRQYVEYPYDRARRARKARSGPGA